MSCVTAEFFYVLEGGVPVARVDRIEPGFAGVSKSFLPYLANTGGFNDKPGLNGTKLPLYHLDELRAAIVAGETVYLVEGEGKADRLRTVLRRTESQPAVTTIQGGAKAPMMPEHVASFAGAKCVVVLADSDEPGRRAAKSRAQRIADAEAERDVRIIDLYPTRDDGLDVADWLAEGHAVEDLLALATAAQPVALSPLVDGTSSAMPPGSRKHYPTFVRVGELLEEDDNDELEYVIEGLLPLGGTAILAGRPKGGKSTLALNLALAVARGEPFMGRATRPGSTLYVALEGARGGWKRELSRMGASADDDFSICIDRAPDDAVAWLRNEVELRKPRLVVIDTMQRLLRVKDGNDYAMGSNATDAVIELARQTGAALLLLHHSGKRHYEEIADEVLGSTAWAAAVDTVLVLRCFQGFRAIEAGEQSQRLRTLASEQRYGEALAETIVEMDAETHRVRAAGAKADFNRAVMGKAIADFLRMYANENPDDPFASEPRILEVVPGRKEVKQQALREAVTIGAIERTGAGKKNRPYRYCDSASLPPDYIREAEKPETENPEESNEIESFSASGAEPKTKTKGRQNLKTEESAEELFAYADKRIGLYIAPKPIQGELDL